MEQPAAVDGRVMLTPQSPSNAYARAGGACFYCGGRAQVVDHALPVAHGHRWLGSQPIRRICAHNAGLRAAMGGLHGLL